MKKHLVNLTFFMNFLFGFKNTKLGLRKLTVNFIQQGFFSVAFLQYFTIKIALIFFFFFTVYYTFQ